MALNFDLSAAVKNWRQDLLAQQDLSPDARRELSAHLQDTFAELRGRGLNEEEAYQLARKRIGELHLLDREFKKAIKTAMHLWMVAVAAWMVFIVSFFLPALNEMPGWKASLLQDFFWPQALQGQWLPIHYLFLTPANLFMVASPFLLSWAGYDPRFLKWLRGLSLGAALLTWSFIVELLARQNGADLKFGCYLWAMSFTVIFLASLLQTARVRNKVAQGA